MKFLLLCFFVLSLSACKKKDSSPAIDFGPNGGITVRDSFNYPQGTTDPTDWTLDGTWNQQEQELFKDLGLDLNGTATGTVSNLSAFPNPVEGNEMVFGFEAPIAVACSFVLVDANYQVVLPLQSPATTSRRLTFSLNVSGNSLQRGKLYRLYYVMRNGATLYYKGHGDIQIGM